MAVEFLLVAGARAKIERNAVMGAGHHDRRVARHERRRRQAAQPIRKQDRVACAWLDGVNLILQRAAQQLGRVVQPLAEEACGDAVG